MSRGPGRVERAIEAAFTAAPSATFSVAELGPVAYPGLNRVEKRHRVAILRAAEKVVQRLWWKGLTSQRPGGSIIYCNLLDVRSYALGRLRADFLDGRDPLDQISASLEPPLPDDPWRHRNKHHLVAPGGAWWKHVEIARARKVGDMDEAARIDAELKVHIAQGLARLGSRL